MITPEQQIKHIQALRSEIPSMLSELHPLSPSESKSLDSWANEEVCKEFLESHEWDLWTASFKIKKTLQWRKELSDPLASPTSPIKAILPQHLLQGLQAANQNNC
ncbi:hypothetical protein HDU98_012208 [Podochytrium sp. JEL0797]|nr:hypothetical protein HDU98_012208 [Podochytrium sp. JEL0797]